MMSWDEQDVLYGVTIKASFFDAEVAQAAPQLALRALPFLTHKPPRTVCTEEDRKNFYYGDLVAQPDAVFAHGAGLIAVEYKSVGGQPHTRANWRNQIRLKDMLQCMIAGYAVAQTQKQATACVLRYHNVCYLLTPEPSVMFDMLDLIPMAKQYYGDERRIAASQLAQFAHDRIRSQRAGPPDQRSAAGRAAHAAMLRR